MIQNAEFVRGQKCPACAEGFHDGAECERPGRWIHGTPEGSLQLCCCDTLGLWFDREGVERWPDGTRYDGSE